MPRPDFKSVYSNPDIYWPFLSSGDDNDVEGQQFDRKQAGEIDSRGSLPKNGLAKIQELVEKTMIGFANATGGILILGISKTGDVTGVDHLTEDQRANVLAVDSVKGAAIRSKEHAVVVNGDTKHIALLMVEGGDRTFCCRTRDDAVWIRKGPKTVRLKGEELEQLKRDRKVVEFERVPADAFNEKDVDDTVVEEFIKSQGFNDNRTLEEVLRDAGAINGNAAADEWTNAGLLFFAFNPRRVLAQAYIRLLRFDCSYNSEDERPTPDFDKDFDGTITKQIRDLRTFIRESGFFKTYEVRGPDGGFVTEPEYPIIAIDEAVVNAVAHRDYGINLPTVCEKYTDAFVIRSPGRLQQPDEVPQEFRLNERILESVPRNAKLMDWLRSMKDAKGTAYVKAIREGTRKMRDEMSSLGLPSPTYKIGALETTVVLQNDSTRRTAKPTGLASEVSIQSEEYTNLYRLEGFDESGAPEGEREQKRILLRALCDKLETKNWVIDSLSRGRAIVHLKSARINLPEAASRVVRIIPAYSISIRSYSRQHYLVIDYTVQVQTIWKATQVAERFDKVGLVGLKAFASVDGKLLRGSILNANGDHLTLRLYDSDEEFDLPANTVYPNLRKDQLDKVLQEKAPDFDVAKAIKTAALSTVRGAARQRVARIEQAVQTINSVVFPLTLGAKTIGLSVEPLPLLRDGDGKRALRIDEIEEPEVEFGRKRATANIRDGITTFGAYKNDPHDVEIIGVVQPGYEQLLRDLVERLQVGAYKYRGAERTFSTRLQLAQVSTAQEISVDEECRRLVRAYPKWSGNDRLNRLMLVHTPESGYSIDDVSSPYYQAKRILLEAGLPCQMVDTPTLRNPDYKDLNLALNVVAKTGVTPWVLPETIPDADFFVGLSYTSSRSHDDDRVLGFANVFNRYGRWEFYSGGNDAVPFNERAEHYERLVFETLSKLNLSERPTVYFHYSAKFGRIDREAILRGAQTVRPRGKFVFIWINTHHPVRLFDARAETDGSVARGKYVIGAPNQIYLSTTGYNSYRKTMGTPQALEVNVYVDESLRDTRQPVDHRALARQILSLTKLNWASTDALCGEPITTKYAKDIAYLTAAFQRQQQGAFKLHPVLERTPWFI